ncbi:class A beta-lactamase [Alishewanella sp. HH-ZS]|uniref:class A beta-lactamase n=1 Tax=Alishewanella sp. HH-ZS TaxID=1856684 RepID=UPI00082367CD|nr:class A beta-lactamase [Alishewanella sp. HH-ZS]OCW93587.1 class A beta-lactamase [Alishewanella sp. HH-ZS]
MLTRRDFLLSCAATTTLLAIPAMATTTAANVSATGLPARRFDAAKRLQALEVGHARLGVCLLDTATGEVSGNRLDEYFAMCSTFKLALAAAYLREADQGRLDLDEMLPYSEADLLPWAPVTREHLAKGGMTIIALLQAAQQFSDGVAANLLVKRLGGPAMVTAKFREMGDNITRLDRYEPDLGLVLSADLRDTTTPRAMAQLVQRITCGELLQQDSRQRLLQWMESTNTGSKRLRAGLPATWRSGNKTGTGRTEGTTNKYNDIAITFPPGRSPIIIAAYFDSGEYTGQIEDRHQAVLADVGRIAAEWALA